ncbi:hypothetical protein GCM10009856_23050 [Mycolicibacterium llatzerense]
MRVTNDVADLSMSEPLFPDRRGETVEQPEVLLRNLGRAVCGHIGATFLFGCVEVLVDRGQRERETF